MGLVSEKFAEATTTLNQGINLESHLDPEYGFRYLLCLSFTLLPGLDGIQSPDAYFKMTNRIRWSLVTLPRTVLLPFY